MTPKLNSIDHIHVFVDNRDAAKRWYQEVLGLIPVARLAFWASDGGPLTLSDADENVHIALFESTTAGCRSTIALGVQAEAFMAWRRHLSLQFNTELPAEDHGLSWSLYFSDPYGNPYEITTYEYEVVSALLRAEPRARSS